MNAGTQNGLLICNVLGWQLKSSDQGDIEEAINPKLALPITQITPETEVEPYPL